MMVKLHLAKCPANKATNALASLLRWVMTNQAVLITGEGMLHVFGSHCLLASSWKAGRPARWCSYTPLSAEAGCTKVTLCSGDLCPPLCHASHPPAISCPRMNARNPLHVIQEAGCPAEPGSMSSAALFPGTHFTTSWVCHSERTLVGYECLPWSLCGSLCSELSAISSC